ncbi:hypothetical protein [Chryseobacterium lathyri]|uniref:hypothetical protein n=1 Tax=Chryseobacterium lathyri TaxID=395933 RepID=UPI002781787E|nr:hypothetical protein [Chryseobacterium lathyri]MDQ0066956.1 NADH:ubiquinone oxidoreductase subunit 5 (subunit L)/multisubunit Na+/H+ antiporter MnhA subunit [Chryseobacterium lathyri]
MNFHEHYSRFLGDNNIYKNLSTIKKNVFFDFGILILLLVATGIGVYFFAEDTVKNSIPLSETYNKWHFKLTAGSLVLCYAFIVYERIRLFRNVKKKVGYFKQNMLGVILFGINWDSIILKYYWFDKLYNFSIGLQTKKIEFFKNQNDKELANITMPKFPINLSGIISFGAPFISILSFILLAIGVEEGKEQKIIILLMLLLISPIFFVVIMFIRDNFNEKKNDYKNMQNYSLALGYILDKRKLDNVSQQENLPEE